MLENNQSSFGWWFSPDETKVSDLSGSSETNNDADVLVICTTPSITITKDGMFNDSTSPNGITNPGIQSLILLIKVM
jgi:hypothetical protein